MSVSERDSQARWLWLRDFFGSTQRESATKSDKVVESLNTELTQANFGLVGTGLWPHLP